MSDLPFGGIIPLYFPPVRVLQHYRIIPTICVRRGRRVLVRHRVNGEPDGEGGVVVPRRGRRWKLRTESWKVVGHGLLFLRVFGIDGAKVGKKSSKTKGNDLFVYRYCCSIFDMGMNSLNTWSGHSSKNEHSWVSFKKHWQLEVNSTIIPQESNSKS